MKTPSNGLSEVKDRIAALKGKAIEMEVNKGRKRIAKYEGVLEDTYSSVFVVRISNNESCETLSCSYCDVLCGAVKMTLLKE